MMKAETEKILNTLKSKKDLNINLKALIIEHSGNWDLAHKLIQYLPGKESAWVHAYLHRKEGDEWNSSYWYSVAGKKKANNRFDEEWEEIFLSLTKYFGEC